MWNSNMIPTPLTIDSLRTSQKRRLERNRRGKMFAKDAIKDDIGTSQPDPNLKSGGYLPSYRKLFFTPELINVPLDDLDPFYVDKETFLIVTDKKLLHRFSAQNALNLFSPFNPVRRTSIAVLHHWIYHWFMIMIAFVDCFLLAQPKNYYQPLVFLFFGATYTFDFVTNVIASGLIFDQFTFLREGWGIVDLLLLVPYYIPHIGRHHFLCGLRALKIAALIPSLQSAVKAVLKTARDLRDMFLWALFATWIFTLVGYHFFMGVSSTKCVRNFPEDHSAGETRDLKWHNWISNSSNWQDNWYIPGEYQECGNYSMSRYRKCPGKEYTCLRIPNDDDKLYGSIDRALLSTLRLMLQDSWDRIYFVILRTGGPWNVVYFVATLIFGSFYTLNMILGVVSKSYVDIEKELKQTEKLESILCKRSTSNISGSSEGEDTNENDDHESNTAGFNIFIKYLAPIKNIWKWLRNLLHIVVFDPFTELIMAIAIVGNLVLLSMDRYEDDEDEQNQELQRILVSGHQIFGIMFAVECLVKFFVCGPVPYLKDKWNIFDFTQTILFLVDVNLDYKTGWMNALLSLRSLRIFKLAKIWPTLNSTVNGVFSVLGNVSDMTIVAIGVFYMFSVAGVHVFGGNNVTRHHPESHWHFRDFWHSFMVNFRLLCGEWLESMSECVDDHGWICIPFFISAAVVLDMIVLNFLLVMFLQRFSTRNSPTNNIISGKSDLNTVAIAVDRFKRLWMWMKGKLGTCLGRRTNIDNQSDSGIQSEVVEAFVSEKAFCECPKLRAKSQIIMNSNFFEYFIIGNTIVATICLSLRDAHLKSRPQLEDILTVAENITLFFMAAEAVIKIIAIGFSVYIRNKWNQLDLFILLGGIFNIILSFVGYGLVALFRSMRVLRLVSNFEGMRILFSSLGRTMLKICGTLLVCLIIWLVFAIIGVQLFKGRFQGCAVPGEKLVDARIIRNKGECLHLKSYLRWGQSELNFDNVGSAYFRVLEIITFKGWTYIFQYATNSGDIYEQPSFEKNFWLSGYFVVVVLFGSFFAFNLFTGDLIDGLNDEKAKTDGSATKFRMESGYHKARKDMLDKLRIKLSSAGAKTGKYQKFVLQFVTSKQFEILILLNYGINMVSLSMEQRNNPNKRGLLILNGICTVVFATEALLNIFANGGKLFRNPHWILELFTELLSLFDICWTEILLKTSYFPFRPSLLRLIRFARVSRYLRHVQAANGLRQLISVLQVSLPAFWNICVLLLLITFIYATLGMEIFKGVRFTCCFQIDYSVKFDTLLSSLLSLFPLISSAGWEMFLAIVTKLTDCISKRTRKGETTWYCGNTTVAATFVMSYLFITFVILVNMFSAVILDNYSGVIKLVECELREEHFEMFYEVWSQFDKETSQFIGYNNLSDIFESFKPPFQVSKPNCVAISLMNIPVYEGNLVHCTDVLDAAITCFYFRKGVVSAERFNQYQDEMKNEKNCKLEIHSSTFLLQQEQRCAIIIQRAWRMHSSILNE